MDKNSMSCFPDNNWEEALKQIVKEGELLFSSMVLRKYFDKRCHGIGRSRKHVDLADVYGKLVWMGYCHQQNNTLLPGGYFQSNSIRISEGLGLSVRRTREIANILQTLGLIKIKKSNGESNCYKVIPEAFISIVFATYSEDE